MSQLLVRGGTPLHGEITASGAKNAALPLLAACLLTKESMHLQNIPDLQDVSTMLALLKKLGVEVKQSEGQDDLTDAQLDICAASLTTQQACHQLVRRMRASFLVLGPLLATKGYAEIPMPGGCAIGARPVNEHLQGFRAMAADVQVKDGVVIARAEDGLRGGHIVLNVPTVTGTENILMAATLARGQTIIENAAREPEIVDLIRCLKSMGAHIQGAGSARLVIDGVSRLHGTQYSVMPDRIECGSYLIAAAVTGGRVHVLGADSEVLASVLSALEQAGASVQRTAQGICVDMQNRKLQAVDIDTAPYPGFPTDLQPQFMVLNAVAEGSARMTENLFEGRLKHVQALKDMGADIALEASGSVVIKGVGKLSAASVKATDLRASFGLATAALAAEGETLIDCVDYIDRGYESVDAKLATLGADIQRLYALEQACEA